MTAVFRRGDQVTVLPPYDDDPLILAFQQYATVAEVVRTPDHAESAYLIELDAIIPAGTTYGAVHRTPSRQRLAQPGRKVAPRMTEDVSPSRPGQ